MKTTSIAFLSLCFGLGPSGCYDGHGGGNGANETDQMGVDTDGAGGGDGDGDGGSGDDGPVADPPQDVELVPQTMSRRLTQAELDTTLKHLLGDETRPARTYLAEPDFTPYDDDYTEQSASRTLIESMEVLARDVADRLIDDPARRGLVVPCEPSGPGDQACFRQAVETFGRLALRRPLSEEEVDGYLALQQFSTETIAEVDNDFYTGLALALSAMMQAPEFLYRIEAGTPTTEEGVHKLNDYEIASRISYLLWGSTPDDALLADAEAGNLSERDARSEVVARVLGSDKARTQLYRQHAMWLGYRGIPHDQTLVEAFNQETTALIERVVFDDASNYGDLFRSTDTYLSTYLADHYGLPQPPGGEGWVEYDDGRAGILSHGAVLAAFSKFTDTSPTMRGIFVNQRLRCMAPLTPPPGLPVDAPPAGDGCKEARYQEISADPSCAACHETMDPIGIGLENYDLAGRFRETDEDKPECVIAAQGELPGVGAFNGPAELASLLLESGELERCVTKQYLQYALGRPLEVADAELVSAAYDGFETSDFDFKQMMADFANAEAFGFRRESGN